MFRTALSVFALVIAYPAFAEDIAATSTVAAATVYPQGAQINREAEFSVQPGTHKIVIDDLPLDFDAASLRVTGKGTGDFAIISVDHRIDRLPPPADVTDPIREKLEGEIKAISDQIIAIDDENALLQADIAAAQTRMRFAETLMQREPQDMVDDVEHQRAGPETWVAVIALLTEETRQALRAITLAEASMRKNYERQSELNEDLADLEAQWNAVVSEAPPRSVATVELVTDMPVTGTLTLSYQVWNAGWQPVYDLRLDQSDKPTLIIDRHARVTQTTGEDWQDVALTLSTARPSGRMDTPDLLALGAYISDPILEDAARMADAPAPTSGAIGSVTEVDELNVAQEAILGGSPEPIMADVDARLVEAVAALQGQTVVYALPETADVAGDGTVRQLGIDSKEFDVKLLARATPEFDPSAYLYATLTNAFAGPLLPGPTSVFRDGTFVGTGSLPLIAEGKDVILPFGVLDGITVKRVVLDRQSGDSGILTSSHDRSERFLLSAESVLSFAIPLTLYDRVPYSEQEDLEIAAEFSVDPSVIDVEGKRGVLNWTFLLEPGARQVIEFGYEMSWPEEKVIGFRE